MNRFWFAVFCIVSVVAVWGITTAVCLNIGCTFELYLGAVIVLLGAQLVLLLTVGRSRLRERIRRHRVRKHIRVSGVRCTACAKEFVLTIGETERFPWEI